MALSKGDTARIIQPVVEGEIVQVKFNEDTGEKRLLLEWTDGDDVHHRWFSEGDLEAVPAVTA